MMPDRYVNDLMMLDRFSAMVSKGQDGPLALALAAAVAVVVVHDCRRYCRRYIFLSLLLMDKA